MNRRRWLIALAVLLPVAVFVPAKITASWRPVAIGPLTSDTRRYQVPDVRASQNYVVAGTAKGWESSYTRFDLRTGEQLLLKNQGLAANGAVLWKLLLTDRITLTLRENGGPAVTYRSSDKPSTMAFNATYTMLDCLRASADRVEMIRGGRYYRWNKTSRQLESEVYLRQKEHSPVGDAGRGVYGVGERWALTRDSKTAVRVYHHVIVWRSTSNGNLVRRVPFKNALPAGLTALSPFGSYVLYSPLGTDAGSNSHIFDAATARELWKVQRSEADTLVLSPDEKSLAISRDTSEIWEVRDLQTGAIVKELPLVPDANAAAFSPDGATLYSVADGVLYRQRAR